MEAGGGAKRDRRTAWVCALINDTLIPPLKKNTKVWARRLRLNRLIAHPAREAAVCRSPRPRYCARSSTVGAGEGRDLLARCILQSDDLLQRCMRSQWMNWQWQFFFWFFFCNGQLRSGNTVRQCPATSGNAPVILHCRSLPEISFTVWQWQSRFELVHTCPSSCSSHASSCQRPRPR